MYYIARLSGGTASAVAADRAIQRFGRRKVLLRFKDTLFEDEDLYRFLRDLMRRWGGRLYHHIDGRTPLVVAEQKHIIPNSGMAPCSFELKIAPFERWLWRLPKPVTILSGLGWQEPQRINKILHYHKHRGKWRAPQGFARRIPGVYEDFPLLWQPIEHRAYFEVVQSWGIEPPRLYKEGFPHNNCGGRCVRQGISEWHRLRAVHPERFAQMRDWEQEQRAKGGARANAAFCSSRVGGGRRPITLVELEQQERTVAEGVFQDDLFSCFCTDV